MISHMNLCLCVDHCSRYLRHLHHRFCHRHSLCLQAGEGVNETRISLTDLLVCKAREKQTKTIARRCCGEWRRNIHTYFRIHILYHCLMLRDWTSFIHRPHLEHILLAPSKICNTEGDLCLGSGPEISIALNISVSNCSAPPHTHTHAASLHPLCPLNPLLPPPPPAPQMDCHLLRTGKTNLTLQQRKRCHTERRDLATVKDQFWN